MQKISVIFSFIFLIFIIGCAKYKPNSFTKPIGTIEEKNKINSSAQLLSELDCRHYFSRSVLKKGYQPIQLCIQNQSDQSLILDASTINMPIENKDYVVSRLQIDATPRVAGWGIAGLFFWPLFIPAVVEAIQVPKANKMLDKDFESRTLDMNSRIIIRPYSTLNRAFFVRKENISDHLQFTLNNPKNNKDTNFNLKV